MMAWCHAAAVGEEVDTLIVGAGPGGLQLASLLHSARRSYVVLDGGDGPMSFFGHYPRWRQLISVNKPATGTDNLDFNDRHDWNSLLPEPSHVCHGVDDGHTPQYGSMSDGCVYRGVSPSAWRQRDTRPLTLADVHPSMLFRSYSHDYYPHADDLLRYGQAFQSGVGPTSPLRVRYGVRVTSLVPPTMPGGGWTVVTAWANGTAPGGRWRARRVVLGTGMAPIPPSQWRGVGLSDVGTPYSSATTNTSAYTNRSVLIVGHGNAAFEFADGLIASHAARIHVAGSPRRVRLSHETHYTGDLRATHAGVALEAYNLKSQVVILNLDVAGTQFRRRASDGRIIVTPPSPPGRMCTQHHHLHAASHSTALPVDSGTVVDDLPLDASTSLCGAEEWVYDAVVVCPGARFQPDAFPPLHIAMARNGKHPAITPTFASPAVPDLYFVGSVAHALDFRRSSGGFIHGFRYTARALHRHLEEEDWLAMQGSPSLAPSPPNGVDEGGKGRQVPPPAPWPATPIHTVGELDRLVLHRLHTSAGLFQLFGFMTDVFLAAPHMCQPVHANATTIGVTAWSPVPPRGAAGGHDSATTMPLLTAAFASSPVAGLYFPEVPGDMVQWHLDTWQGLVCARFCHPPARPACMESPPLYVRVSMRFGDTHTRHGDGDVGSLGEWVRAGSKPSAMPKSRMLQPTWWRRVREQVAARWSNVARGGEASYPPRDTGGGHDPLAVGRVTGTVRHPQRSSFLHPVLEVYDDGVDGDAPIHAVHLLEQVDVEYSSVFAHRLPLRRLWQLVQAWARETVSHRRSDAAYHTWAVGVPSFDRQPAVVALDAAAQRVMAWELVQHATSQHTLSHQPTRDGVLPTAAACTPRLHWPTAQSGDGSSGAGRVTVPFTPGWPTWFPIHPPPGTITRVGDLDAVAVCVTSRGGAAGQEEWAGLRSAAIVHLDCDDDASAASVWSATSLGAHGGGAQDAGGSLGVMDAAHTSPCVVMWRRQ